MEQLLSIPYILFYNSKKCKTERIRKEESFWVNLIVESLENLKLKKIFRFLFNSLFDNFSKYFLISSH